MTSKTRPSTAAMDIVRYFPHALVLLLSYWLYTAITTSTAGTPLQLLLLLFSTVGLLVLFLALRVAYGIAYFFIYEFTPEMKALPNAGLFGGYVAMEPNGVYKLLDMATDKKTKEIKTLHTGISSDGYNTLFVTHPEDIKMALVEENFPKLKIAYDTFRILIGNGLVVSSGEPWRVMRKITTPVFHFANLKSMIPVFSKVARETAEKIACISRTNPHVPIDPFPIFGNATLRVIIETAFGGELDEEIMTEQWAIATKNLATYMIIAAPLGISLTDILPLPFITRLKQSTAKIREMVREVIVKRKNKFENGEETTGPDGRPDLLHNILQASNNQVSTEQLIDESMTFLFAGHDTTSNLLSWSMHVLSTHPEQLDKLRHHLNSTTRPHHDDDVLRCYLNETLRLHPPVPFVDRISKYDCTLHDGTHVPAGTAIFPFFLAAHYDPSFWEDPHTFNPDRFQRNNTENDSIKQRHTYSFIPFSAGGRNCIGSKFAMMEAAHFLAEVVQNFRILPSDPTKVEAAFEGALTPRGLKVVFEAVDCGGAE